mmetsp:Transcript_39756/g.77838  ORF Transcript_39756/g.77838 Transcript_39756/m.77838 type:complete len:277 (+) Transcript_39756:867-1697(+)
METDSARYRLVPLARYSELGLSLLNLKLKRRLDRSNPLVPPLVVDNRRDPRKGLAVDSLCDLNLKLLVEARRSVDFFEVQTVFGTQHNLLHAVLDSPSHLGEGLQLVTRHLKQFTHLNNISLLARQERKLNILRLTVLLKSRTPVVVVGKADCGKIDWAIAHDVISESILVCVAHTLNLVPIDKRVKKPVAHHDQKGVTPRDHLVELLVFDTLIVLSTALGESIRSCLDGVKASKLDRIVTDLVGMELDGLLPKDLLDRLHVSIRRYPKRQVVVRY